MKAKKAAPKLKTRGMAMMKNNSSGESDAEDNAKEFGAGFNQFNDAKKKSKKVENKKGSFLGGLFGGFGSKKEAKP